MEAILKMEKQVKQEGTARLLLWLGIAGMIMLFAGLTSAYIVRQAQGNWLEFELPRMFYVSSALILLSSLTMNLAVNAAKTDQYKKLQYSVIITLLLGAAFALSQFLGWSNLYRNDIVFAGKLSNPSGSFMYVITGLHVVHVFGGIIALLVVLFKSYQKKYTSKNSLGLQLCATYWHFLDGLWIYLFLFLLLVG